MYSAHAQRTAQRVVLVAMTFVVTAPVAFAQEKTPVPDAASQAKAQELVRGVYGQEYAAAETSAERLALAKKMLDEAAKTKDDPVGHFILLRIAKDVAVLAGDAETALEAVDQLVQTFDVDPIQTKVDCLEKVARAAKPSSQHGPLAEQAFSLVDAAVAEDNFEAAGKLGEIALESARKARNYKLVKQIVARMKAVKESEEAYAEYQKAMASLEDNPTEPDANLSAGRYLCLVKSDWEKGLPMLALGSDADLKAVAVKELKDANSPDTQVALGDAWWELAQKKADAEKEALMLRAGYWYQQAQDEVSGLTRLTVGKRLEEIAKIGRPISEVTAKQSPERKPPRRSQMSKPWEIETVQFLGTLHGGHSNITYTVAFNSDGSILASGNRDTTVKLWNMATGQVVRGLQPYEHHTNHVNCVAFSPDGSTLAWGGAGVLTVKFWNVATAKFRETAETHAKNIQGMAFSPDGSMLATASADTTVKLWDVSTGKLLRTLQGHIGPVISVTFLLDDATLVSGGRDRTIRFWDPNTGRPRRTLEGHTDHVLSVAVSPDGSMLASGSTDRTVKLWRVSTGEVLHTLQGHTAPVWSVAFSPDGSLLASGSLDKTVRLWDLATGGLKSTLGGTTADAVYAVAFSPNGSVLVSGGDGGTERSLKLWGPAPGKRR